MVYNEHEYPLVRKAVIEDVEAIHEILNAFAAQGKLLPRSLSELYEHLRAYYVLETVPGERIQGVCGLGICWKDLAEIESLAITEVFQGQRLGRKLVDACLREAASLGLDEVFTLTYVPDFFVKIGFYEVDKSCLPHKIWADCLKCPKFPDCDETALMLKIENLSI
ncbi:MAG: N-acetyltransferase [Deltaproteobacteria bacterium]|nr:N-acetyltransferase [Deltaproteobacteria bacterium]